MGNLICCCGPEEKKRGGANVKTLLRRTEKPSKKRKGIDDLVVDALKQEKRDTRQKRKREKKALKKPSEASVTDSASDDCLKTDSTNTQHKDIRVGREGSVEVKESISPPPENIPTAGTELNTAFINDTRSEVERTDKKEEDVNLPARTDISVKNDLEDACSSEHTNPDDHESDAPGLRGNVSKDSDDGVNSTNLDINTAHGEDGVCVQNGTDTVDARERTSVVADDSVERCTTENVNEDIKTKTEEHIDGCGSSIEISEDINVCENGRKDNIECKNVNNIENPTESNAALKIEPNDIIREDIRPHNDTEEFSVTLIDIEEKENDLPEISTCCKPVTETTSHEIDSDMTIEKIRPNEADSDKRADVETTPEQQYIDKTQGKDNEDDDVSTCLTSQAFVDDTGVYRTDITGGSSDIPNDEITEDDKITVLALEKVVVDIPRKQEDKRILDNPFHEKPDTIKTDHVESDIGNATYARNENGPMPTYTCNSEGNSAVDSFKSDNIDKANCSTTVIKVFDDESKVDVNAKTDSRSKTTRVCDVSRKDSTKEQIHIQDKNLELILKLIPIIDLEGKKEQVTSTYERPTTVPGDRLENRDVCKGLGMVASFVDAVKESRCEYGHEHSRKNEPNSGQRAELDPHLKTTPMKQLNDALPQLARELKLNSKYNAQSNKCFVLLPKTCSNKLKPMKFSSQARRVVSKNKRLYLTRRPQKCTRLTSGVVECIMKNGQKPQVREIERLKKDTMNFPLRRRKLSEQDRHGSMEELRWSRHMRAEIRQKAVREKVEAEMAKHKARMASTVNTRNTPRVISPTYRNLPVNNSPSRSRLITTIQSLRERFTLDKSRGPSRYFTPGRPYKDSRLSPLPRVSSTTGCHHRPDTTTSGVTSKSTTKQLEETESKTYEHGATTRNNTASTGIGRQGSFMNLDGDDPKKNS